MPITGPNPQQGVPDLGAVYPSITPELKEFIEAQPLFFVASAPLSPDGHVNLSPKGQDTLRVLSDARVAYLDLTGSGIETAAHIQENGRITLMFCGFQGPPRILRLYGTGRVVRPGNPEYDELAARFPPLLGARQIIDVYVSRVHTSCGMAVPYLKLEAPRDQLNEWAEKQGPAGVADYWKRKNAQSIDGLPGI
jgi:predicted pyridoxine 5'-phosphate oxidase superfamily flavin-nucleotide-binding protein